MRVADHFLQNTAQHSLGEPPHCWLGNPQDRRQPHSPLRIAVIGVGRMGQHHVRILSRLQDVVLLGVSDLNLERGLAIARQYQVHFFETYQDLLPHVDAAIVAVPTRQHYEVGMTCLAAGIHVLIEKPIAASVSEAEALVQAAARSRESQPTGGQRILQVGHVERFNPTFQALAQVLDAEKILALSAHRLSPYGDRANDVSVVLDLMIHDIDLMLALVDAPVVKLTAQGRCVNQALLDDVTATLEFTNGTVATLTASKASTQKLRRLVAYGQHSLTKADFLGHSIHVRHHGCQETGAVFRSGFERCYAETQHDMPLYIDPLYAELQHFVHCIQAKQSPAVGGVQATDALRLAYFIEQIVLEGDQWPAPGWRSGNRRLHLNCH
ncbi:Gfo/Idh/MocA family oxidoreductase [Synechococcales cyanobacterium C]|uniref:Gfo/Idh/MocA family oxidoreductase n=2 Tax=Petrachloros TaxID=2918834 RepID=A0A8K1ZYA2_9CYAN|nr:Gfo/Idh/MocA family oxidoreductase [Petrachloros mirabilis ULC683]